ncbi:hypothetical protein ACWGH8_43015 [Nonomuraea muscovyensis]|uniref:Putative lactoylglutathione lyase n=1 Tax=Nonomuraea muscovyensis TaxID=1124761 RepID=A0A7X0C7G5_9ACTN|nr:hypothetical protein [Nonomuraea muscovyensis]MBB6349930.1 putative lactoylglutathione lyase [Nonomuraea muscovyensis]
MIDLYIKLGFPFDADLTTDEAGCMVVDEHIYALLVTGPSFGTITGREPADTAAVQKVALVPRSTAASASTS